MEPSDIESNQIKIFMLQWASIRDEEWNAEYANLGKASRGSPYWPVLVFCCNEYPSGMKDGTSS